MLGRVTAVPELDDPETPGLPVLEEPEALQAELRTALLDGQGWSDGPEDRFGAWLWDRWRTVLESEGMGRTQFAATLVANQRERWLWVMGERQWHQFVEGQAGRTQRRLATPTAAEDPTA